MVSGDSLAPSQRCRSAPRLNAKRRFDALATGYWLLATDYSGFRPYIQDEGGSIMDKRVHLSPEQWRVAQAILRGEPASRTCARLSISEPKYRKDVQAIAGKLGARSRAELIEVLRQPAGAH